MNSLHTALKEKQPSAKTNQNGHASLQDIPSLEEGWTVNKSDEITLGKFHVPLVELLERSKFSMVEEHCAECLQLEVLEKEGLVEPQEDGKADGGAEEERDTKEKEKAIAINVRVSLKAIKKT